MTKRNLFIVLFVACAAWFMCACDPCADMTCGDDQMCVPPAEEGGEATCVDCNTPAEGCGSVTNDCGIAVDLGGCGEGQECVDNSCEDCEPTGATGECGIIVIDSCGNEEDLGDCEAGECVDNACVLPPASTCEWDPTALVSADPCNGSQNVCRDGMTGDQSGACDTGINPPASCTGGEYVTGPGQDCAAVAADKGYTYTSKCVMGGGVDWFSGGDCSNDLFSNQWGCGMAGGAFECLQ